MAITNREENNGHDEDLGYTREKLRSRTYTNRNAFENDPTAKIEHGERVMKFYVGGVMKKTQIVSTEYIEDLTEHC